jgi:hypothetical protein
MRGGGAAGEQWPAVESDCPGAGDSGCTAAGLAEHGRQGPGGIAAAPNTQAVVPPAGADLAAENARLRRENERLRMEREIKKNAAYLLGTAEMKFRLIEDQRKTFPVRALCDVMGVSAAGYYAWRGRPESSRKAANRVLLSEIRQLHLAHRGRYGAPRIHVALRGLGHTASRGRILVFPADRSRRACSEQAGRI